MRSEDLLNLIGNVDDKFVDELMNDNVVPMRRPVSSRHWFTIAACFAVIILFTAVLMGVGVNVDSAHMSLSGTVAEVPMAEMTTYTIDLRSMTQGAGSFTCKFTRYEEAPGNVQQKVIEDAKKAAEEE